MNITPNLPDGYSGPIKQLTCQLCKQVFYLTWTAYKQLKEVSYCHECSLIERESRAVALSVSEHLNNSDAAAHFPSLLTLPQVQAALHLSRAKIYRLIAKEGLPTIRFGRSVRVSPDALRKWLEQREQAGF